MAVKLVPIQCPACGANISYEDGRKVLYCSYCGAKIVVDQYNENEHIYRHIDDADIKRAETDRMVQMRELDFEEADHGNGNISIILGAIAAVTFIALGCIGISTENTGMTMCLPIGMFVGIFWFMHFDEVRQQRVKDAEERKRRIRERENLRAGLIKVTQSNDDFEGKNYKAVESMLRSAGFRNIEKIPLGDLAVGFIQKPGMVDSVSIGGKDEYDSEEWFSPDDKVIITYHSLR